MAPRGERGDGGESTSRATFGNGLVGTGAYLLGPLGSWSEPREVELWLLLLFFPLVPLARLRVSAAPGADSVGGEPLELVLHSRAGVDARAALRRVVKAAFLTALAVLPLAFGAWNVGSPWAAPLLTSSLGFLLRPSLLDKLGMAIEMGVVLAGVALPLLLLMARDERTARVSLRSALVWLRHDAGRDGRASPSE